MPPFYGPVASSTPSGHLQFGGVEARAIASRWGTPCYVIVAETFRSAIQEFVDAARMAHPKTRVAYASKANSALCVLSIAREEGLDVDVASEGELEAALRAGFPPFQIHLHGSNKSDAELRRAVQLGLRAIVVDSLSEVRRLAAICRELNKTQPVILRVAPGVDPETHHAVSTGQEDTKFGLNISDGSALSGLEAILASTNLELLGYHCHVGSQLPDSEAQVTGASRMAEFAIQNWHKTGEVREINVGGGLGIRYTERDSIEAVSNYCREIAVAALEPFRLAGLPLPEIGHEPGRRLIGEAGATLYTVGVIKEVPLPEGGRRKYLSVDGGLSDNPRHQLYGALYTAVNADKATEPHDTEFRVVGRHCEADTLIPAARLPSSTSEGDLIAVLCTGAYNLSMASNYNRYPRPPLVVVENGQARLGVERETLDDLFAKEPGPAAAARLKTSS